MDWQDLSLLLTRPIAYHRIFATIGGGACAGLFLSQAFYWSDRTNDPEGWFYKTQVEWEEETGLTRYEQETVRKQLVKRGLLETKKEGIPCKLYYRVVSEVFIEAIQEAKKAKSLTQSQFGENPQTSLKTLKPSETQYVEKPQTRSGKTNKLEAVKPTNNLYTEITPEITPETSKESLSLTLSLEAEPEEREREFEKPKPKTEEATKEESSDPISNLPEPEREEFVKFAEYKAALLPSPPVLVVRWIAANFTFLYNDFLKSPERRQAKKKAAIEDYDWRSDPRFDTWIHESFNRGAAWVKEDEAEREQRHKFERWAMYTNAYEGVCYE